MNITHRILPFLLALLFLSLNARSQIVFEKGYYIDNNNNRVDGMIKNHEWKNSPTFIEFRQSDSTEPIRLDISLVSEFEVAKSKYKRFKLDIDVSGASLSNYNYTKDPNFENKLLFLKVLVEGETSLLECSDYNKFIISKNDSIAEQLIYKKYLEKDQIKTNESYKSQLWNALHCSKISITDIISIEYKKQKLVNLFVKYNSCKEIDYINYEIREKKDFFNLAIKPGIRRSNLDMRNGQNHTQNVKFDPSISFCISLDAEFIFPFNKNKWAFIMMPTFQSYHQEDSRPTFNNDVSYKSIELPLGIRYYSFLNSSSKIYFSASVVVFDYPINSKIGYLDISSTTNLNFNIGYSFKNRFSGEIQFGTNREILSNYAFYSSDYRSISILFGYKLF